jgi:hypothetical protein
VQGFARTCGRMRGSHPVPLLSGTLSKAAIVSGPLFLARVTVAFALCASAVWKIRNPIRFQLAVRAFLPRWGPRVAGISKTAVSSLEMACAVSLLLPGSAGLAGAIVAAGMILTLTIMLAFAKDFRAGCGCWRSDLAHPSKGAYLVRNVGLLSLTIVGIRNVATPPMLEAAVELSLGLVAALLVLELPALLTVADTLIREEAPQT